MLGKQRQMNRQINANRKIATDEEALKQFISILFFWERIFIKPSSRFIKDHDVLKKCIILWTNIYYARGWKSKQAA